MYWHYCVNLMNYLCTFKNIFIVSLVAVGWALLLRDSTDTIPDDGRACYPTLFIRRIGSRWTDLLLVKLSRHLKFLTWPPPRIVAKLNVSFWCTVKLPGLSAEPEAVLKIQFYFSVRLKSDISLIKW